MFTIIQDIKQTRSLLTNSNENIILIYERLFVIEDQKIWKTKSYYDGQSEYGFKECSKMSFSDFIKNIFNITYSSYIKIYNILKLENGKDLFLTYGFSNMKTYLNSTPEERKAILEKVEDKNLLSPFSNIKRKLYPTIVKPKKESSNIWKKKYEDLKKKYNDLQKEYQDYKNEIEGFVSKIRVAK